MVWGMNHPPGSNGFYLPGDFEGPVEVATNGWRVRLTQHFAELSPAEQAIFQDEHGAGAHWYACHAVSKFILSRDLYGGQHSAYSSMNDIRDHEPPGYFLTRGNCDKLASMAMFSGPVLTVDATLKDFIEWLDPGVHKFFPIEVRKSRNKPPVALRYIFVVERRIDSFSEVHSDRQSFEISEYRRQVKHHEKPSLMRGLAFRKAEFGDAHIWHEKRMNGFLLCMSDRMQSEIADAGLRIPRHSRMREV